VPLQLELDDGFSTEAWNMVLDHGCRIASVSVHLPFEQLRSFHPYLVTPSVGGIVLFVDEDEEGSPEEEITLDIQGEFTSLRRLSISGFFVPIRWITAPNLIHLSLESTTSKSSKTTIKSVLDILRGCSQLETILINFLTSWDTPHGLHTPVTLPKLRCIELGYTEVWCGLVLPLRFPPGVAVGFRGVSAIGGAWPCESIWHVLAMINIGAITLAHIRRTKNIGYGERDTCLIQFGGPKGSLEIILLPMDNQDPFGPNGPLLSHSPKLNDVKTLHIMDCHITDDTLTAIASAMQNLISITFSGSYVYPKPLTPMGGSPLLFPHLKQIVGLPLEGKLVEMAKARKENGMPLDALDVHDHPENKYTSRCIAELREIIEDVKVWYCANLPECWTSNTLLDAWEAAGYCGPVSAKCCWKT